ncbi:MAG: pyruvate kinase [Eubacteriales bacterium]|nr:pyruvate kinase [Eubacteriales bacterium]
MHEEVSMRKTKIICTIGPSSDSEEKLRALMEAGMNVARFNFSHGTHEEHREKFKRLVRVRRELGLPVATLMDTKGPEIRLRDFEGGKVILEKGSSFTLTTEEVMGTARRAAISYKNLVKDVSKGTSILIDDGLIELRVENVTDTDIHCTVINGGPVSNHKGVNVPDTDLSMPFISEQDRADIEFGCKLGYEYIAASFTRTAEDVLAIREILKAFNSKMKIIAKIESTQGVNNIDEILDVADGVMVARGDLGVEVPMEEVPVYQKHIIHLAEVRGKIVVTATQMLDSMMHNPRPTRAEATDVANAIYDGTTAIMLSGETASGAYPVEAVQTMSRIAEAAENDIDYRRRFLQRPAEVAADITTAISHSTCMVAQDVGAKAIVAVTMSGFTARRISKYKPTCPIIACAVSEPVACQMNLLYGVHPQNIPQQDNEEMLFEAAIIAAKKSGFCEIGDKIVLTAGVPLGLSGNTNMIRVVEVF